MVVATGGVNGAGEKEGLRRMPIIHTSSTTWPNRKHLQETARREHPPRAENGGHKRHVGNGLSPLKQRYRCWRYQCTPPSTSHFKKCQSSSVTSLSGPNTSTLEAPSPTRNSKHDHKASHVSEPLIPSKGSECMKGVSQTEEPQPGPVQRRYSGASISKFAPLQSIRSTREVAANSTERDVEKEQEEKSDNEGSIFGELVTNELLQEWTGSEDLSLVSSAEFRLDTRTLTCVDTIGDRMPHLHSLKLNNSYIPHVRMLGTKFTKLKRLWIGSSQVETLRGIGACAPSLEELYASFNSVHDITPLLDLSETLEVLDLEGNDIRDVSSLIHSLQRLRKVKYLTLQGNPVVMDPLTSMPLMDVRGDELATSSFRGMVQSLMPDLEYLDDIPVTLNAGADVTKNPSDLTCSGNSRQISTHVDPLNVSLSGEYMFLQQCIRECGFDELEAAVVEATRGAYTRPQTSCGEARPRCSASASSQDPQRPHSCSRTSDRLLGNPNRNISSEGRWAPCGVGGGDQTAPSPPTSIVRADRAVMGGAPRLCHRLPPLQTARAETARVESCNGSNNRSGTSESRGRGGRHCSPDANVLLSAPTAAELSVTAAKKERAMCSLDEKAHTSVSSRARVEDAIDTPLFDEADDEWEVYKKNLLRRIDSRGTTMQRWSKYISSESAISSHGGHESRGLSAFSQSTSTRTPSANSGPLSLQIPQKELVTVLAVETQHGDAVSTGLMPDSKVNEKEENAWQQELMRSVAQSRTRTARVASDVRGL